MNKRSTNMQTHAYTGKVIMLMVTLDTAIGFHKRYNSLSIGFSTWVRFNTNTIIATCIQKIYRGYAIRQRPAYEYLRSFARNIPKYMNFRKRKMRQMILRILILNHRTTSDINAKKMMTIKIFLCFQKLHSNSRTRINRQLLNHKRQKKKAAFNTLTNHITSDIRCKELGAYSDKYYKLRMFNTFRGLLGLLEPSLLPIAVYHYRKRMLLLSLKRLHHYTYSKFNKTSQSAHAPHRMRNFHKQRSWKKLSLLLVLTRVRNSIMTYCTAWHLGILIAN